MTIEEQAAAYRQLVKLTQELEAVKADRDSIIKDRDYWKRCAEISSDEIKMLKGIGPTT